jgi:hypothetical protein
MANPFKDLIDRIKTTKPQGAIISLNKNAENNEIEIIGMPDELRENDLIVLDLIIDSYNENIDNDNMNESHEELLLDDNGIQYTRGNVLDYFMRHCRRKRTSGGGKSKKKKKRTKIRKTNKKKKSKTNKRKRTKTRKTNKRKKRTRRR